MLVVVSYDIPDDRRRTRLYKTLEGFGHPVQRSVFECDLTWDEYRRLKQRVERLVQPDQDLVRFYLLCEACVARTELIGGPPVERAPDFYLV